MEKDANTGTLSVEIFSNCKKIWIVEYTDRNYHNWQKLFDKIMQFFRELKSFGKVHPLWFQECFQCVSKVLQECPIRDSRVFCASISHKEFINEQKYMDYNAISPGKLQWFWWQCRKIPHFCRKYYKIGFRCQKGKNYFQVCWPGNFQQVEWTNEFVQLIRPYWRKKI